MQQSVLTITEKNETALPKPPRNGAI